MTPEKALTLSEASLPQLYSRGTVPTEQGRGDEKQRRSTIPGSEDVRSPSLQRKQSLPFKKNTKEPDPISSYMDS